MCGQSVNMDEESLVLKDSAKGLSAAQVGQRIPTDEPCEQHTR